MQKKKARNKVVVEKSDERVTSVDSRALYTAKETASYLRLRPQTLEAWRCLGRYPDLKSTKVGGRIMYLGADILAFLKNPRAA